MGLFTSRLGRDDTSSLCVGKLDEGGVLIRHFRSHRRDLVLSCCIELTVKKFSCATKMVGCAAPNCSNNSRQGHRLFLFPKDPERCKKWVIKSRRDKWKPTERSRLCEREKLVGIPELVITNTPFSPCATFHTRQPMKFLRSNSQIRFEFYYETNLSDQTPVYVTFNHPLDTPNMRKCVLMNTFVRTSAAFILINYNFVNTSINPCVSEEEYRSCSNLCFIEAYNKNHLKCRLPFMPKEIQLPTCVLSDGEVFQEHYGIMAKVYLRTNAIKDCSCKRSCRKQFYDFFISERSPEVNNTVFSFYYHENTLTEYQESLAYTIIGLFCDIGGNLGLYSGLSVLSIAYIAHGLGTILKRKMNKQKILKDPLVKIISNMISAVKKSHGTSEQVIGIPGMNYILDRNRSMFHRMLWVVLLFIATVGFLYLLYDRFMYFLSNPVVMTISLMDNRTVHFPVITVCGEPNKIFKDKRDFVRKRGRNDDEKCDVDILDLLDVSKKKDMRYLWRRCNINVDKYFEFDSGLESWGFTFIDNYTITPYVSPFGVCQKVSIAPQIYSGTITSITLFYKTLKFCPGQEFSIMITSSYEDSPDYSHRIDGQPNRSNLISYEETQIHLVSRPQKPCIDPGKFLECKKKCLEEKLLSKIFCRLPFVQFNFLPECTTPDDAKHTRDEYLRIYTESNVLNECSCIRSCHFTKYRSLSYLTGIETQSNSIMVIGFHTSLVRNLQEVESYDIIKLLCDTGGILGIAMGLSVLSVCDLVQALFLALCCRNKRPK